MEVQATMSEATQVPMERLTAATKRAEAAESERDALLKQREGFRRMIDAAMEAK
jgi:hypothetical protein